MDEFEHFRVEGCRGCGDDRCSCDEEPAEDWTEPAAAEPEEDWLDEW